MRYYTDKGVLSKGARLNVLDDEDGKFFLLLPTTNLPATRTAPATVEKTVLTDAAVTQVEGLQTNELKTYTFNYHRDNLIQLSKYVGRPLTFMETDREYNGEKFKGTMVFGRTGLEVNGIEQGEIYITVNDADVEPVIDARDLIKESAIITTPLESVIVGAEESRVITLETTVGATVTAKSDSDSIATGTYAEGKLTIKGVAKGNTLIRLETSAEGEATSYRTIAVEVTSVE